ncbi:MAG TPA: hypothetical protein VNM66_01390 [Thermodesulfobacteriota bacterium]|nr:hypothetical protein [Thermodesulfobacteriota bacterium]
MPRRAAASRWPLARDLLALLLVAGLAAGLYAWYRAVEEVQRWQVVALDAEGVRLRLPPDWTATPAGYADREFQARGGRGGVLFTVRSWAIPPGLAAEVPGATSPEAAAVTAWAEGQRGQALGVRWLADERRVRIGGARGVLQLFEDRRDPLRYAVVAAVAHEGRLYAFTLRTGGSGAGRRAALRLARRILRTVEWVPRAPADPFPPAGRGAPLHLAAAPA